MGFHGNKRRRKGPSLHPGIVTEFELDEDLHKSNYLAADELRRKILGRFSLESHQLPQSSYRNVAQLEVVTKKWHKKHQTTHKCFYCSFKYHFAQNIISKSDSVCLILDSFKNCILPDQLLIVSNSHVQSTLYLDDSAYTEIRNYQKTLVYLFERVNKSVIFVEMSMNDKYLSESESNKVSGHCKIECYPVPSSLMEEARCYFTKALDEFGSNWSQNKRLSITGKKGVKGTIPQGFDYVHVDFSLSGEGVARVVEDASKFRHTFARNIVASILNLDQLERAYRDNEEYVQGIEKIRKTYRDYDWTIPNN